MSSFKRRVTATPIPGTRPSPYNSLPLLSTGLSSLDDLLGGGLPLSSSLLLESDTPTAYAELLLKFWMSQGIECKQDLLVVSSGMDVGPDELVGSLPGVEGAGQLAANDDKDEATEVAAQAEKMKIAFRYEGMKQHAVTVPEPPTTSKTGDNEVYCSMFDLSTTRTLRAADKARLHLLDVDTLSSQSTSLPVDLYEILYRRIESTIKQGGYTLPHDPTKPRRALRIALSGFASPAWGSTTPSALYLFLHCLRCLLRQSSASAILTFPAHLYRTNNPSLVPRLEHVSDGVVELLSLASSPASILAYPKHNGLLRIPKLPSLGSLVAPSVKLSVLRGMGGAANGGGGGAENNLGFRVKRRRFIIETVNPDDAAIGAGEEETKPKPKPRTEEKKLPEPDSPATVRFANEAVPLKAKKVSVSATIHAKPELFEF